MSEAAESGRHIRVPETALQVILFLWSYVSHDINISPTFTMSRSILSIRSSMCTEDSPLRSFPAATSLCHLLRHVA